MASREVHELPPEPTLAHIARSREMIGAAVAHAEDPTAAAAVLGCGRAAEIPLDQMRGFSRVDLVDLDDTALDHLLARYGAPPGPPRFAYHHVDLTGLVAPLAAQAAAILGPAVDATAAADRLAALIVDPAPSWWRPPDGVRFRLLVCSGVLTQLQAGVRAGIEAAWRDRFDGDVTALAASTVWREAALGLARRLEDGFVRHLDELIEPGGVIYLADTVHVSWLVAIDAHIVETPGAWLATRTARLADHLGRGAIVLAEGRWPWFRPGAEGPYWGRLYGVQAVIYRAGTAAAG
jgi:hypothetical protein